MQVLDCFTYILNMFNGSITNNRNKQYQLIYFDNENIQLE